MNHEGRLGSLRGWGSWASGSWAAMAGNLLAADYGLVVHSRTRARAEPLAEHGAEVATRRGRSPRPAA